MQVTVDELFTKAGLVPVEPVPWGTNIGTDGPKGGVYIVTADLHARH